MQALDSSVHRLVVGKVIAYLRKEAGFSQEHFASAIGTSQPTLSRIERGEAVPDVVLFSRIAAALGLTSAQLSDYVDRAIGRAQQAAAGATQAPSGSEGVWKTALQVAGIAGLAGLIIFAVAAALSDAEE